MSYIPFPVDEILNGLVQLVRANRTCFSPNVATADLDEFWGNANIRAKMASASPGRLFRTKVR